VTLSKFTVEELRAQGMLMDMFYDAEDHTFNKVGVTIMHHDIPSTIIDADTHEPWDRVTDRFKLVSAGEIGASDYLQYKRKMLGYERKTVGKDTL